MLVIQSCQLAHTSVLFVVTLFSIVVINENTNHCQSKW